MMRSVSRLLVGLLTIAAGVGCSSAPDLPFDVRATEIVWCAGADGVVDTVTWQGHDGPLHELDVKVVGLDAGAVTEEELMAACGGRLRWLTGATLCEAYATSEALDEFAKLVSVSEWPSESGSDRPGFPVVVRDRVSCADVHLRAGPAAAIAEANDVPIADRLRDWAATQRFNEWRDQEAAWRVAADGGCLDIDAARAQALAGQSEIEGDWPVFETAPAPHDASHAGLCLDVRLQREGFIEIGYHAVETPHGRSGPVDDLKDEAEQTRR